MNGITLAPFKEFISASCGLRFDDNAGEEKLIFALAERLRESGFADQVPYLAQIKADRDEFQRLVNLLTINETYFFREREQLQLLAEQIVPRLLVREGAQLPVRILSAGCSSGEEPYSLAMSLWERYGESLPRLCSITGVDIDSAVLAKARKGQYGEFSFRGVSTELRQRYFERAVKGWQLKDHIRAMVGFQELNLLAQAMPQSLHDFDIIFFRNVSIYFDEPTRRQIQQNLSSLMKQDGILMIGCAETIANDLGVFDMVEEDGLFYFTKGSPPLQEAHIPLAGRTPSTIQTQQKALQPVPPDLPLPVLAPPDSWQRAKTTPCSLDELQQMVQEKRYDEAMQQIEALLDSDPKVLGAQLLKAFVLLNRKQFDAARNAAQQVLEQEQWNTDAFLLLGLAAKWDDRPDEAISWFKQAVYACHTCWPARYYLADIYNRSAETELARREYRTVLQFIAKDSTETGITLIALGLPAAEIRLVCEHQLTKLGNRATG